MKPGKKDAAAPRAPARRRRTSYGELVGRQGGLTPLLIASRQGYADTVNALLRHGADVNGASEGTKTSPLLVATMNGHFDLAMELLEGTELAARLRSDERLPLTEVSRLAKHIASGLDTAHAAGIIHRDLKPQNLFYVERTKTWKILDFGVSKFTHDHKSLTGHGKVVGTPGYMAPEQARGKPVDRRTDVFALGSVLYRCLTGSQAFVGSDIPSILYRIVYKSPAPPTALTDGLPQQIDAVLAVAMAKRPDARFQTAGALAHALECAIQGELDADIIARAKALAKDAKK